MADRDYSSTRYSRRLILAGSAGAAGAALVGCGDDSTTPKTTAASPTTASGATPASTASAAPTAVDLTKLSESDFFKALPENPPKTWKDEDIKPGGRHIRAHLSIANFDFQNSTTSVTLESVSPVYNRLIRLRCSEGMKSIQLPELEGDLAAKWERPDAQTMVFTLNPGIKFHNIAPVNGRAMTVDDIKQTFQRGKTFTGSQFKSIYALFDTIEDIGNNQIRVKLSQPEPVADLYLTNHGLNIYPAEIVGDADALKSKMIGTGAFQQKAFTPNVSLTLDKNPGYWKQDAQKRALPYLDGLDYQIISDLSALELNFETGKVDSYTSVAQVFNFDNVRDINKRVPSIYYQFTAPAGASYTIGGHMPQAPWSDIRVRRAFSLLVPRDKLAQAIAKSYASANPFFPWPVVFDKDPTIDQLGPWFKYDPKQAKDLLAAAGFPSGLTTDLEWFKLGNNEPIALILQQEAAAIGWKLNLIQNPDQATHFTHIAQKNWSGLTFYGRPLDFVDVVATARSYVKGQSQNGIDNDDATLNDLWAKLPTSTGNDRKTLSKQIFDRQQDQMYDVGLPTAYSIFGYQGYFENMVGTSWSSTTGRGGGQFEACWHNKKT